MTDLRDQDRAAQAELDGAMTEWCKAMRCVESAKVRAIETRKIADDASAQLRTAEEAEVDRWVDVQDAQNLLHDTLVDGVVD